MTRLESTCSCRTRACERVLDASSPLRLMRSCRAHRQSRQWNNQRRHAKATQPSETESALPAPEEKQSRYSRSIRILCMGNLLRRMEARRKAGLMYHRSESEKAATRLRSRAASCAAIDLC